ncbi:MAG: esterase, partial [Symploca sp. SIO2B6]|nr:esterase [Symploca sp. SIO2B6]
LGQRYACVERLLLLAPAFQFLTNWQPKIPTNQWQQWEATGSMYIYHYSQQKMVPLEYGFVTDLKRYSDNELMRPVPTRIIHGLGDDVVPIQVSQDYVRGRSHASLLAVNSDHSLGDQLDTIWTEVAYYLK